MSRDNTSRCHTGERRESHSGQITLKTLQEYSYKMQPAIDNGSQNSKCAGAKPRWEISSWSCYNALVCFLLIGTQIICASGSTETTCTDPPVKPGKAAPRNHSGKPNAQAYRNSFRKWWKHSRSGQFSQMGRLKKNLLNFKNKYERARLQFNKLENVPDSDVRAINVKATLEALRGSVSKLEKDVKKITSGLNLKTVASMDANEWMTRLDILHRSQTFLCVQQSLLALAKAQIEELAPLWTESKRSTGSPPRSNSDMSLETEGCDQRPPVPRT